MMNTLYYTSAAEDWNAALPVGNGRLGAMVFGGVQCERLQLNEETLWSGGPQDADNPASLPALAKIRELLFAGRYAEAQALTDKTQTCRGAGKPEEKAMWDLFGCYQTLGDLELCFDAAGTVSEYRRELSLDDAIAEVRYTLAGHRYRRECFVSAPDQVLVLRIESNAPISFSLRLNRQENADCCAFSADTLHMVGQLRRGDQPGMRFSAAARIVHDGGRAMVEGNSLIFSGASSATILVAAKTDFICRDPAAEVKDTLDLASARTYADLRDRHFAEYRPAFARVTLDLGPAPDLPTDTRLERLHAGGNDHALIALLFQFGRYLLLCSSRKCHLPANLQGIWADGTRTPWNCDYHTDINVQMNYWLAEPANLPECVDPLVRLIQAMRVPGARTALTHYNARGWTVHTIHNVWGFTSPGTLPGWGLAPSAGAWLCQHLWEHYAFGQDLEYLRRVFPVLREAAEFAIDWLVGNPQTGKLVSGPATSPENAFKAPDGSRASITMGPTMDQQIYFDLFTNVLEAAAALGTDDALTRQVAGARDRLAMPQIGPDGRLMEWPAPFEEVEPQHRHVSHLFGLHPARQISPRSTPQLADAARKTLLVRGDGGTGWSRAWKICFWARLHDGDHAYAMLRSFMEPATTGSQTHYDGSGSGTYPNLLCAHPPFQIDGNFGAAAGIAEMLLQSHEGEISLLPALPRAWADGTVAGLRARDGFTVDITWRQHELQSAVIHGQPGKRAAVCYRNTRRCITLSYEAISLSIADFTEGDCRRAK